MKTITKCYLNGWLESIEYVNSLTNVKLVGTTKSPCGYYELNCYETI